MFGRWSRRAHADTEGHALFDAVRRAMPDADGETQSIVAAIAGLLGGVAYADRDYSSIEEERVRAQLGRVQQLSAAGVDAVLHVLRDHIVEIATVQAPRYARVLLEQGDHALRLHVLEMLVDLAAADDSISHEEVQLLRNTTTALGLDQRDYNDLQRRHRDKLTSLRDTPRS